MRFRVVIGLRLDLQSYPRMRPYMRFLYVRPEVCPRVSIFPESSFLQIPPHGGHPCLRLCPSHYRADSGLAPVRNVRRRAHKVNCCQRISHDSSLFIYFIIGVHSSTTPDTREIIRRSGAPDSMSQHLCSSEGLPELSPLRDPVFIGRGCGWAEVPLYLCVSSPVPEAVRHFEAAYVSLDTVSYLR